MQLQYLLAVVVVSDASDIKLMSSSVGVTFAITRVVNNYNIRTEPLFWDRTRFLNQTEQNSFRTESDFFQKPNRNRTEIEKIYSTHP